jgi:hypothetical protein
VQTTLLLQGQKQKCIVTGIATVAAASTGFQIARFQPGGLMEARSDAGSVFAARAAGMPPDMPAEISFLAPVKFLQSEHGSRWHRL